MNCPQCGFNHGHYSTVTYQPEHGAPRITEAYWFCHTCAKLVYETDPGFVKPEVKDV